MGIHKSVVDGVFDDLQKMTPEQFCQAMTDARKDPLYHILSDIFFGGEKKPAPHITEPWGGPDGEE